MIAEPWREELHAYLGGIARDLRAVARSVGGTGDHVHILAGLKATQTLADVVRQIKCGSSAWIHRHGVTKFQWQAGYGAFTVSSSQLPRVQRYIANQIEHHRTETFEEEYIDLLRLSGVEFDEKYLFMVTSPRTTSVVREPSNNYQGLRSFYSLTPGNPPFTPSA
jgi:REP element-mobilizing transposase RayT